MNTDNKPETKKGHKYQTRSQKKDTQKKEASERRRKKNESSDDEDDDMWESGDDEIDANSAGDDEMDMKEYRKLLSAVFPSKYIREKANATPSRNKRQKTDDDADDEQDAAPTSRSARKNKKASSPRKKKAKAETESETELGSEDSESDDVITRRQKSKKTKNKKKMPPKKKKKVETETEDDDDSDDSEYTSGDDDGSEDSEADGISALMGGPGGGKFNIIFTMGGPGMNYGEHDDETESDDDDYEDDEDDEDDDEDDCDYGEDTESESDDGRKKKKKKTKSEVPSEDDEDTDKKKTAESDNSTSDRDILQKFKKLVDGLTESERENKVVKGMMTDFDNREKKFNRGIEKRSKKAKRKNTTEFRKMLREKNVMNDVKFFKENMSVDQQRKIIQQMKEVKEHCEVEKPYRLALLDAQIPIAFKASAYKKINTLKYMEPGGGEYYKIKNWVDTFMQIPFGKHKSLPITMDDGIDKCHDFMENAKCILDKAVYGLDDAKLQIMQMVGQWIANPDAIGTAIAIKGPMGTGKTTLVKEGISQILGREFAFIALGGATDSSFLEGHSYTYEGSTWGKIVDILIQCKSMNPVIYFDELDKVSDTPKGEEIIGILTHLTDTTQNSKFHDKYFSELDFDLSRCMFIFSYNDESKINPILKDRMYRIQTKGYNQKEKTTIANDYLLPKIREQVKFSDTDIVIPDKTVQYIVDTHTGQEAGVRNLKRCLEIVHTKLNLYRLMKPGTNLFEKDMSLKVEFPVSVTPDIVDKLIKKTENDKWKNIYV